MKDRPQSIGNSPYSLADLDSFHEDFSYLVYELMFKDAFKHQYDVFKKNFKLDLNSFDNLNEIVKKWGDAEIPLSVINKTLKKDIERCVNNRELQLPAEQNKMDQLVKPLGYYFHIQLRLAQLKYHIFNYSNNAAESGTFHREQGIIAARKLNKLLLKAISFTTNVATSKHSFTLWGISLTHPAFYNQEAARLKEINDGFNHKCKKLLEFASTLTSAYSQSYELKGSYQAVTFSAEPIKQPPFKKAKKRIVPTEEILLDKNDMQPKQGVNPTPFKEENNKLSLHPVWEMALGLSLEASENSNQAKEHFSSMRAVIKATTPATNYKKMMVNSIKHEDPNLTTTTKDKQIGLFQRLRTSFITLLKAIINAFSRITEPIESTKANSSSDTRHMIDHFTKEENSISPKRDQATATTHESSAPLEKDKFTPPKKAKNISKEAPEHSARRFK